MPQDTRPWQPPPPRPDYVVCVSLRVGPYSDDAGQSWCGRPRVYSEQRVPIDEALRTPERGGHLITDLVGEGDARAPALLVIRDTSSEFAFMDAAHALLNARGKGRLLICPECAAAMATALHAGTYREGR